MRACTQTVCFSNMENNEMNNTDTLEKMWKVDVYRMTDARLYTDSVFQ